MKQVIDVAVGKRLLEKRQEAGLTIEQLAQSLDLSPLLLSSFELGRRRIPAEVLMHLCSFFNVKPGYFLRAFAQVKSVPRAEMGKVIPLRRKKV